MADAPPRPPAAPGATDGARRPGGGFDPRGAGAAWTHDFLNKKAWHPMSFKNRTRVWEAEQAATAAAAAKERRAQEYEAEREYLRTIATLVPEERERYRQRQAVSWLYQKPPGFDAARAAPAEGAGAGEGEVKDGGGDAPAQGQQQQQQQREGREPPGGGGAAAGRRSGGNYVAKVVGGVQAVVRSQQGFDLKQAAGGMSPPRGGIDPGAENQRLIVSTVDPEVEAEAYRLATMPQEERERLEREAAREGRRRGREARRARAAAERQRVHEAVAFLRAAGIEVPGDSDSGGGSSGDDSGEGESGGERRGRGRRRERRGKRRRTSQPSQK